MSYIDNNDPIVGKKSVRVSPGDLYSDFNYNKSYAASYAANPAADPLPDPLGGPAFSSTPFHPNTKAGSVTNAQQCGLLPMTAQQALKLEQYSINVGIQTAMQQGLAPTYAGLVVRDIIPAQDLIDQNGSGITKYEWRQPVSGGYTTSNANTTVYKTSQNVKSQQKVYVFWGARVVNNGPWRVSGIMDSAAITWTNPSATAIYDVWQTEALDIHNELYTKFPIVYGTKDPMRIDYYVKNNGSGQFDNIQLLGKIVEPRGQFIQGVIGFATNFLGSDQANSTTT
jgi:hypothetical protein